MINLKSSDEISIMREAGKILGDLLDDAILCKIEESISTNEIDKSIEEYVLKRNAIPILKGYCVDGVAYKHASCISLNNEVVHAPPSNRTLNYGDIVSVDVSIKYKGYCVDAARSFIVGDASNEIKNLVKVTEESFYKGFEAFKVGNRIGDVSNAVQRHIEYNGLHVIKDFCGHGIGKDLHEGIQVMNYGEAGFGPLIEEGLTIALEPMVSMNDEWTRICEDGWTAISRSGSLAAHYENTIVALRDGPEILTKR